MEEQLTISDDRVKFFLQQETRRNDDKVREIPTMKAELKKFDNFLANFAGCSTGRPVDTLLAAVQKKVEKMGHSVDRQRIQELEEEVVREVEWMKKYSEENMENIRLSDELDQAQKELKAVKASITQLNQQAEVKVESTYKRGSSIGGGRGRYNSVNSH